MSGAEQALHDLYDPLLQDLMAAEILFLWVCIVLPKTPLLSPPQSRESQATRDQFIPDLLANKYLDIHMYGVLQGRRLLVHQATKIYQSHIPSLKKETLFYQGVLS